MRQHGTADEMKFIGRLYRKYRDAERVEVFRTYVHMLHAREKWEGIDAEKVMAYAKECLNHASKAYK